MLSAKAPKKVIIVAAAAVGLLIPLTVFVAGEPAASNENHVTATDTANACQHVDAPMVDVPSANDTEPQMRIPQPAGWERVVDLGDVKHTRLALMKSDSANSGSKRKLVTVSLHRAPLTETQKILDQSRAQLVELYEGKGWPTELTTTPGAVCGQPAETITYAGDPALGADPATVLFVAINAGGHSYVAMLLSEPADPSYQRDAETILSGFEVLAPESVDPTHP